MSCPSSNSPRRLFEDDGGDVPLPREYYIATAGMIILVIIVPLLYRQIWLSVFGFLQNIRRPKHLRGTPPGLRRIGKAGDRNLSLEYEHQAHSNGHANGSKGHGKVEGLFVYPIKSCYPVEVESSTITSMGCEFDRQFCFAQWHEPAQTMNGSEKQPEKGSSAYWDRTPHWEFLTQRQTPSLTHLKVEIWVPDPTSPEYNENLQLVQSGGCLVVSFAFAPHGFSLRNLVSKLLAKMRALDLTAKPVWTFQVPLNPTPEQISDNGYGNGNLRIWRDEPRGIDMTSEIPDHILNHLTAMFLEDVRVNSPYKFARIKSHPELRLYRVDHSKDRPVYKNTPMAKDLGFQSIIGYQDSYPMSIQNLASIADVNANVPQEKDFKPDARRFRANIYVSGPDAYEEDDWTLIRIGDHQFHVSCRTTRCKLPTNDPDTGRLGSDVQPYNYLVKHRNIDEGAPKSGCLGMMMVPTKLAIGATIRIGDEIEVLKKGKHFFVADARPEAQQPVL